MVELGGQWLHHELSRRLWSSRPGCLRVRRRNLASNPEQSTIALSCLRLLACDARATRHSAAPTTWSVRTTAPPKRVAARETQSVDVSGAQTPLVRPISSSISQADACGTPASPRRCPRLTSRSRTCSWWRHSYPCRCAIPPVSPCVFLPFSRAFSVRFRSFSLVVLDRMSS